jgi:hypothetical protein
MVQGNDNNTIADAIVALITPAIGQLAFLYRMAQMRSAVVSFGRWGGFYASGNHAYRLCLGFVAITWLPLDERPPDWRLHALYSPCLDARLCDRAAPGRY